jgi:hypothetical protein
LNPHYPKLLNASSFWTLRDPNPYHTAVEGLMKIRPQIVEIMRKELQWIITDDLPEGLWHVLSGANRGCWAIVRPWPDETMAKRAGAGIRRAVLHALGMETWQEVEIKITTASIEAKEGNTGAGSC